MANVIPNRPRAISQRRNLAVVASQFNPEYVRGMIDHFRRELAEAAGSGAFQIYEVPGAFEIPVVIQELGERGGFDALVAFGVIIKGDTHHAEFIGSSVTDALMDCALRYRIPIIHEVLVVNNEEQAKTRCLESEMNRGTEAARSVLRIIQTMALLKGR